jgi:ABC-type uncharacterized transport system permease subunit
MLAGTSILCFTASYAVALALEASRLLFRSRVRGALLVGFGLAGFFAHSVFLGYRAATEKAPLASEFDWYLVAAWLLALVYLYLTLHFPRTAVGVVALPLVLVLLGAATRFAQRVPFPQAKASQFWSTVHGLSLLVGTVAVLTGFLAGVMHLLQSYRLKHKLPATRGFQLPSLEWLERANSRFVVISALALGVGFLSGMLLNQSRRDGASGAGLPWTDPVVWSSALLLGWMTAAALFSLLYKPARQGRKVAYLTVASFVFLALVLGIQLMLPNLHGAGRTGPAPTRSSAEAER